MKKEQRKKWMNIIVIIVTIGMLASVLAGITLSSGNDEPKDSGTTNNTANKTATVENNEAVTAEIKAAEFGSIAKVTLTAKGKEQYKDAATYELSDSKGQMSKRVSLGSETTIFPAMKAGDKVDIKIYTKDNKEIAFFKATFAKGK